jgi:hypothetical protein
MVKIVTVSEELTAISCRAEMMDKECGQSQILIGQNSVNITVAHGDVKWSPI